jgi:hypothetical protein
VAALIAGCTIVAQSVTAFCAYSGPPEIAQLKTTLAATNLVLFMTVPPAVRLLPVDSGERLGKRQKGGKTTMAVQLFLL